MFTFSEMLALVQSESSFGAYVCHRRPAGLHSDQRSCLCLGSSRLVTSMAVPLTTCHLSVTTCQSHSAQNTNVEKHEGAELKVMQLTKAHPATPAKRLKQVDRYSIFFFFLRLTDESCVAKVDSAG